MGGKIYVLMAFSFQHTEYLPGLAIILLLAALFWQVLHWKKNTVKKIGDTKLVEELISNYSPFNFMVKFCLACLALAAIIFGAANLQKPGAMDKVNRKGVDVVIALDVSKSMLAEDVKPSRLEKAREFLYRLMDQLQDDRVGLVLFAGRAYMQMPLTTDHGAARMYIQQAGPDAVPTQGTVIAEALRMSNSAFNSKERKYKSIVLITDGEDHDPDAVPLSKQLAGDGVMINTVGIGSPQGAPILDPSTNSYKKDDAGNTVISKLNEPELQQLAADTKGIFVELNDVDVAVSAVMKQLDSIAGESLEDNAFKEYRSYFQWFLAIALVLLAAEFFFPESKLKKQ
jgi:Ca-activated chloride channel family protein